MFFIRYSAMVLWKFMISKVILSNCLLLEDFEPSPKFY